MIRVFPRRTKWTPDDELAFVGDPPLFRPSSDHAVLISVTFTWDIVEGFRLQKSWRNHYDSVSLGGPAFNDPGYEFDPGFFIKKGVTITSRGCPWKCPWCFVPKREGGIRELEIKDGWIVQDNNLLACSREHQEKVFEMLIRQKKAIKFSGGLDTHFLSDWHVDWFKRMKIDELWVSCDDPAEFKRLEKAADLLSDFPQHKKRCYVIIGFHNETLKKAEWRLNKVYELGFLPFSQLFQGIEFKKYSKAWKDLNRNWSRPAIIRGRWRSAKTLWDSLTNDPRWHQQEEAR